MLQEEGPVPLGQLQDRHRKRMGMQQCLTLSALGSSKDVGLRNFINGLGSPLELVLWELESRKLGPPPNKGELCVRLTKEALRRLRQPAAEPCPAASGFRRYAAVFDRYVAVEAGGVQEEYGGAASRGGPRPAPTFSNDCSSGSDCPRFDSRIYCRRTRARRASWLPFVSTLGHPLEVVPCTEENLRPPPTGDGTGKGELCVRLSRAGRRPTSAARARRPPRARRRRRRPRRRRRRGPPPPPCRISVERGAGRRAARRRGGGRRRRRARARRGRPRRPRWARRSRWARRPRRRLQRRRRRRRGRRQQLRRVHGLAAIAHLRSVRAPVRVRDVLRRGDERQQGVPDLPRARPDGDAHPRRVSGWSK